MTPSYVAEWVELQAPISKMKKIREKADLDCDLAVISCYSNLKGGAND